MSSRTESTGWFVGEANIAALKLYKNFHKDPGDFLTAVLIGDLYAAARRADIDNQQRLFHIVKYIQETLPEESYGSSVKVKAWLTKV